MEPSLIFLLTIVGCYGFTYTLKKISKICENRQIKKFIFKKTKKLNQNGLNELLKEGHEECIFCYEEYKIGEKVVRLYCNHVYHKKCLKTWFKESIKCPLCNLPIQTSTGNRLNEVLNFQIEQQRINNNH